MADCFSLPNAVELVNFLRVDAKELSMLVNGKAECNVLWKAADVIEQLLQKAVEDDAAIALIRKKAEDEIEALLVENARLKAERDAAVEDLTFSYKHQLSCFTCKHDFGDSSAEHCLDCRSYSEWEWRGHTEKNSETELQTLGGLTMNNYNELIDGLQRLEFFNQRAGRELWADKPHDVQERDIESAQNILLSAIGTIEQLVKERDAAVADLQDCMHYAKPKNNNVCNFCKKDMAEYPDKCAGWSDFCKCEPEWSGVTDTNVGSKKED